jgi:hypothetical protein
LNYIYIIPKCNCSDPNVPIVDQGIQICYTRDMLKCVRSEREAYEKENLSVLCGKYCPEHCTSVFYSKELSFAYYPNSYYTKIISNQSNLAKKYNYNLENFTAKKVFGCYPLNRNISAPKFVPKTTILTERIRDGTMMLSVHYTDLTNTLINESPAWTIETLIGLTGGQLGLFCGK